SLLGIRSSLGATPVTDANQTGRADVEALLEEVGKRLPGKLAFDSTPGGPGLSPSHPLAFEVEAIREGRAGSLPYVNPKGGVVWFTLAPTYQGLHQAYADLRAWIFPSFGWEDPDAPVVPVSAARGALGARIAALSPAGYLRWHSTETGFLAILSRLRQMRLL